jgi:hypothetical protein
MSSCSVSSRWRQPWSSPGWPAPPGHLDTSIHVGHNIDRPRHAPGCQSIMPAEAAVSALRTLTLLLASTTAPAASSTFATSRIPLRTAL